MGNELVRDPASSGIGRFFLWMLVFNILPFKISYVKFPEELLVDEHSTHQNE